MTEAPASRQCSIVGTTARMRVSSAIRPSSSGTLRSTRRKTRFPARSSRSTLSFGKLQGLRHVPDEVLDAVRVAPLVVVPGEDLDHGAVDHRGGRQVHDGRVRVAVEVHRDQLLVRRIENAAQRAAAAGVDFPSSAVRSTTDTFEVGTRMARPSSLPLSSGSTRPTAVAAPVVVGIMLTAPARARRRSLCGKSWMGWSFVYECTVDMKPRFTPKASSSTFTVVARQLVVQ